MQITNKTKQNKKPKEKGKLNTASILKENGKVIEDLLH